MTVADDIFDGDELTVLAIAHVADGRSDAYWNFHHYPWDAIAGMAIAREAGGWTSAAALNSLILSFSHLFRLSEQGKKPLPAGGLFLPRCTSASR